MERSTDNDYAFVTDDELTALALASDPDLPIGSDAVPVVLDAGAAGGLLPAWYMPAASTAVRGPVRRALIGGIVIAVVVINCAGLCVTYGLPEIAW